MNISQLIPTSQAAEIMGVSARQVRNLINDDCPFCDGDGCEKCLQTGHKLPAQMMGKNWFVLADGLELEHIKNRQFGKPAAGANTEICARPGCGKEFQQLIHNHKYCSRECRLLDYKE